MHAPKFSQFSKTNHRRQFSKLQRLCICTCRAAGQNVLCLGDILGALLLFLQVLNAESELVTKMCQ